MGRRVGKTVPGGFELAPLSLHWPLPQSRHSWGKICCAYATYVCQLKEHRRSTWAPWTIGSCVCDCRCRHWFRAIGWCQQQRPARNPEELDNWIFTYIYHYVPLPALPLAQNLWGADFFSTVTIQLEASLAAANGARLDRRDSAGHSWCDCLGTGHSLQLSLQIFAIHLIFLGISAFGILWFLLECLSP